MFIRSVCQMAMLLVLACSTANASVISTYTDRSAWEAALAGSLFSEESFNGDASFFTANSRDNSAGLVTVDMLGGTGDPGPTGLTGSGYFQGELDASPISDNDDGLSLYIHHIPALGFALLGLQNDSFTNPAGLNLVEVGLLVDGDSFLLTDLLGMTNSNVATDRLENQLSDAAIPFVGFVLDQPVTGFSLVHASRVYAGGVSGTSEEFYLDGVVLASETAGLARQYSVPAPGSLVLMLSGFAGLFVNKRMRRM